eukprot:SAG11_NODE_5119_length_1658_cov_1.702373_1_plen_79_part_00
MATPAAVGTAVSVAASRSRLDTAAEQRRDTNGDLVENPIASPNEGPPTFEKESGSHSPRVLDTFADEVVQVGSGRFDR